MPNLADPAPDSLSSQGELGQAREALAAAQRQIEVLSTFTALSEAAAATSDLKVLAQHAEQVLSQHIPDLKAAYYERQGQHWIARVTTGTLPPALLNLISDGLPLDTPCFAQRWPPARCSSLTTGTPPSSASRSLSCSMPWAWPPCSGLASRSPC
ncbi:hypothetical protein [Deinococcus rubellus]|uniref:hypothetical protein n=1 Tax=Deinococcus rubellus TaxID=1889240 RepID=UPI0031EF6FA6